MSLECGMYYLHFVTQNPYSSNIEYINGRTETLVSTSRTYDELYNLDSNRLTGKRIVEMQWTILHQVKAQTLEPLPWILSRCLSPISSSFHHCNKLLITDTTILKIKMWNNTRQSERDLKATTFKLLALFQASPICFSINWIFLNCTIWQWCFLKIGSSER